MPFEDMFNPQIGPQFFSPMDAMYAASGGLNVSSPYVTPTWAANMRPQYGGPTGYDPGQAPPFSTFGAFNALGFNPLHNNIAPSYIGAGTWQNQAASDLVYRPTDAAANFAQQWITPLAIYGGAAWLSGRQFGRPSAAVAGLQSRAAGAWATAGGMMSGNPVSAAARSQAMAAAATRQSFGSAMGRYTGAALGRASGWAAGGLSGSMGGAVFGGRGAAGRIAGAGRWGLSGAASMGRMGAAAGSMAGAAIGALAVPWAIGYAATEAFDQMVWDPFISGRQGQQAYQSAGIREFTGQTPSGFGIGGERSAYVGSKLASSAYSGGSSGAFNAQVLDVGSQMGMFSDINLGDSDKVIERTKRISRQVKVLMKVANEPNFVEAMKLMSEFQAAGASGAGMDRLLGSYSAASSISGVASRRIMETVGKQGQMMFQQAGFTPYVGQMQAASAFAGISNAAKAGLVSPATLAMLGGSEGATQSVVGGITSLASTSYNKSINLFGNRGSLVSNLNNIGNEVAVDPMRAQARLIMGGGAAASKAMENNPFAPYEQVMQMVREIRNLKPGQQVSASDFVGALKGMGADDRTIQATMANFANFKDPAAFARMQNATHKGAVSSIRDIISNRDLDYTDKRTAFGRVNASLSEFAQGFNTAKSEISTGLGVVGRGIGSAVDYVSRGVASAKYGSSGRSASLAWGSKRSLESFSSGSAGKEAMNAFNKLSEELMRDPREMAKFEDAKRNGRLDAYVDSKMGDLPASVRSDLKSVVESTEVLSGTEKTDAEVFRDARNQTRDIIGREDLDFEGMGNWGIESTVKVLAKDEKSWSSFVTTAGAAMRNADDADAAWKDIEGAAAKDSGIASVLQLFAMDKEKSLGEVDLAEIQKYLTGQKSTLTRAQKDALRGSVPSLQKAARGTLSTIGESEASGAKESLSIMMAEMSNRSGEGAKSYADIVKEGMGSVYSFTEDFWSKAIGAADGGASQMERQKAQKGSVDQVEDDGIFSFLTGKDPGTKKFETSVDKFDRAVDRLLGKDPNNPTVAPYWMQLASGAPMSGGSNKEYHNGPQPR